MTQAVTLQCVRRALAAHTPELVPFGEAERHAAVALILAGDDDDLDLCFIRRAERESDPWSGHMALPGGRVDPSDESARAAAERETREEVGIVLEAGHHLGTLAELPVRRGGNRHEFLLSSFVYHLGPHRASLHPEPGEVAEAFWVPLAHLWDGASATRHELERPEGKQLFPGIQFRQHVIWGLTFRLLELFSDVLDHPLPHLGDSPELDGAP